MAKVQMPAGVAQLAATGAAVIWARRLNNGKLKLYINGSNANYALVKEVFRTVKFGWCKPAAAFLNDGSKIEPGAPVFVEADLYAEGGFRLNFDFAEKLNWFHDDPLNRVDIWDHYGSVAFHKY